MSLSTTHVSFAKPIRNTFVHIAVGALLVYVFLPNHAKQAIEIQSIQIQSPISVEKAEINDQDKTVSHSKPGRLQAEDWKRLARTPQQYS